MEYVFALMCLVTVGHAIRRFSRGPSLSYRSVDALVPAYNEGPCLAYCLTNLLENKYIEKVICVNDGSTDNTGQVIDDLARAYPGRLIAVHQRNSGKGGALMHGLKYVTARQVFLTDADTLVPPERNGLGYLLAEIEDGADAVGGIPSSNLAGAGFLPYIRASVKFPMIAVKRTFQQVVGGAPFIISGACGMFRVDVLQKHGFSDRTKVEDLDLTWTLVAKGYTVRQSNRCVVYPQECNTLKEEWRRWRRWIVGYAVCMRLHKRLLLSRFGVVSMLPMVLLVMAGVTAGLMVWPAAIATHGVMGLGVVLFPVLWVLAVTLLGLISAIHHRNVLLVPMASLAVLYVLLSYAIWIAHGVAGLISGKEPERDKPGRYTRVVD